MLDQETLLEVAENVWSTVMEAEAFLTETSTCSNDAQLSCSLGFEGAWAGTLYLTCSRSLLAETAGAMFDTDEPSDQDCDDVLTEITNIMGGMIKGLLPAPTSLQLPVLEEMSELPDSAEATHVLVMAQDTHEMSVLLLSEAEQVVA